VDEDDDNVIHVDFSAKPEEDESYFDIYLKELKQTQRVAKTSAISSIIAAVIILIVLGAMLLAM